MARLHGPGCACDARFDSLCTSRGCLHNLDEARASTGHQPIHHHSAASCLVRSALPSGKAVALPKAAIILYWPASPVTEIGAPRRPAYAHRWNLGGAKARWICRRGDKAPMHPQGIVITPASLLVSFVHDDARLGPPPAARTSGLQSIAGARRRATARWKRHESEVRAAPVRRRGRLESFHVPRARVPPAHRLGPRSGRQARPPAARLVRPAARPSAAAPTPWTT